MILNKRVTVVLPAYNAAKTLQRTYDDIPKSIVDDIILTDDASSDGTVEIALALGLHTIEHTRNRGLGGNLKMISSSTIRCSHRPSFSASEWERFPVLPTISRKPRR